MAQPKKSVHLFADQVRIADRWTQRDTPAQYYAVGSDVYDVISYVVIRERDGSDGFDVQVVLRPSTPGSRHDVRHI